jgi:hypothetical protein
MTTHQGTLVTHLDRGTRLFMEHGFGEDFRDVTVAVYRGGDPPGPPAWTIADRIHIAERWYAPETALGRHVLAHELAHVVQKRRPMAGQPSRLAIEAEAQAAANRVGAGGRFTCSLADHPAQPRAWGVAGHYYTSYFVLLAAGVDHPTAAQMAFYAQMPDQVDELDATERGIDFFNQGEAMGMAGGFNPVGMNQQVLDLNVQMGLHSLTGRDSAEETELRRARLAAADFGSFEFGLAIHPYGDSFAHRMVDKPSKMYMAPLGHAVEKINGRDPHCPDYIQQRPALYREYAQGLYDIVCAKTPYIRDRLLTRDELGPRLAEVSGQAGDIAQVAALRLVTGRDLCQIMNGYQPENEALTLWPTFVGMHPELSRDLLKQALALAQAWVAPT